MGISDENDEFSSHRRIGQSLLYDLPLQIPNSGKLILDS